MNPAVIQDLISHPETKITNIAKRHSMDMDTAFALRNYWVARILNICSKCSGAVKNRRCVKCGTKAPSSFSLLKQLKPESVLVRAYCGDCGTQMTYTVKDVLGKVKKYGYFKPNALCFRCREESQKEKEVATPPVQGVVKPLAPIQEVRIPDKKEQSAPSSDITQKHIQKYQMPLTHRPFGALEGLKIEKAG